MIIDFTFERQIMIENKIVEMREELDMHVADDFNDYESILEASIRMDKLIVEFYKRNY